MNRHECLPSPGRCPDAWLMAVMSRWMLRVSRPVVVSAEVDGDARRFGTFGLSGQARSLA